MHLTHKDIQQLPRIHRLNLINSITGIKPANLVGTVSENKVTNLAIFSSVVHLGSNPALLGFVVRPAGEVNRHTYENLKALGCYTINAVHSSFTEQAHSTSAKFADGVSEFEQCRFTEEYIDGFAAPFVKESHLKIGLLFREELPITINNTILVIGEVQLLVVPDEAMDPEGHLNLQTLDSAGISGLNTYYTLQRQAQYPYARTENLSSFIHDAESR